MNPPTLDKAEIDHFAVNKYMLSLGFHWNTYDSAWFKNSYVLSQSQAVNMYTEIPQQNTTAPILDTEKPTMNGDFNPDFWENGDN